MIDMYGSGDVGVGGYKRLKTFVDMINTGLSLTNYSYSSLPILFMMEIIMHVMFHMKRKH